MNYLRRFTTAAIITLASSSVHANLITFDEAGIDHGSVISDSDFDLYDDVTISAINFTAGDGRDFAVAYDSSGTGGEDSDLEKGSGWGNSNLDGAELDALDLGNVLIVQENHSDPTGVAGCAGGKCDSPDDEGQRLRGIQSVSLISISLWVLIALDSI